MKEQYQSHELMPVLLWNRTLNLSDHVWFYDIAHDSEGNIYLVGGIENGVTPDMLTLKYDSSGNEIWNVTYDGGSYELGYGVTVDSSGNVYVTGEGDNGVTSDMLTFKYDSSGNEFGM
ncbi:SBBP repeat-containing protein [Candidatus Woesearchaeota archaeon]|nr:SBBP repeat-containing protein [Candidatus Woesearchaeota archaeon]